MKKSTFYLFCALALLPIGHLLVLSCASEWTSRGIIPPSVSLQHWQKVWHSGLLTTDLFRSVLLSGLVAFLSSAAGYLLGRHLSESPRKALWLALAYLPYAFSPVIYAYSLRFFFLNAGLSGSFAGVFVAQTLLFLPFSVLFFINFWDARLAAMRHLALTLGSSHTDLWLKVWLPLSRPALRTVFAQIFLFSWFDYGLTTVIGSGRVTTLTLLVWQYIAESNPIYAAIGSSLLILPAAFLLLLSGRAVSEKHF